MTCLLNFQLRNNSQMLPKSKIKTEVLCLLLLQKSILIIIWIRGINNQEEIIKARREYFYKTNKLLILPNLKTREEWPDNNSTNNKWTIMIQTLHPLQIVSSKRLKELWLPISIYHYRHLNHNRIPNFNFSEMTIPKIVYNWMDLIIHNQLKIWIFLAESRKYKNKWCNSSKINLLNRLVILVRILT